jgi:3-hydroxyacyl-[acyl-carrier-protein] dehydratase
MTERAPAHQLDAIQIARVMQMIPHRYPMLLIDKVTEIVADERAHAIKNVTINEPQFQGHFPTQAVMPGVFIIESMAQTAAVLVVYTLGGESEGKLVYFMTIDNARFRRPIVPGDVMHVHVTKRRNRGAIWKFRGEVKVDGKLAAEAEFSAMIRDA